MKTAFVFPGQGSQKVGMGKDLYDNVEASKSIFDLASSVLGFDLAKICFEGPEEKLCLTEISQPAILATSIAILSALGKKPDMAAGHSLGEYSALVCAGSIEFKDAVKIVNLRGKFMQEAVPAGKGAMAAIIGLEREKIFECLKNAASKGIVEAANFNCPGQIVISGEAEAVDEASRLLKEAGAKRVIPLAVSAPFHSSMMTSAANKLKLELDKIEIKDAKIPVVSNVTANSVTNGAEIKALLVKQVLSPVFWEDSIKKMESAGIENFVEIGNGNVLSGLIKKTSDRAKIYNVEDLASLRKFSL